MFATLVVWEIARFAAAGAAGLAFVLAVGVAALLYGDAGFADAAGAFLGLAAMGGLLLWGALAVNGHIKDLTAERQTQEIALALLARPDTTSDGFVDLVETGDETIRLAIAQSANPAAAAAQRMLVEDPDSEIREALAGNEHAPLDVFEALAEDPEHEVRRRVVANPSAPRRAVTAAAGH